MEINRILDRLITFLIFGFVLSLGTSRGGFNLFLAMLIIIGLIRYRWRMLDLPMEKSIKRTGLFFGLTLLISTFSSGSIIISGRFLLKLVVAILPFFIIAASIKKKDALDNIANCAAVSFCIGSIAAIYQGLHGVARAKGFTGIMDFAGLIGLFYPVFLVYTFETREKCNKIAYGVTGLLMICALLYNGTRSIWITVVMSTLIYLILQIRKNLKTVIMSLLVVVMVIGLAANNPTWVQRSKSITNTTTDTSNIQRLNFWRYAWTVTEYSPIFGVGLGAMPAFEGNTTVAGVLIKPDWGNMKGDHVHNTFLQIMAETGVLGLMGFIAFFMNLLNVFWQRAKKEINRKWAIIAMLTTFDFLLHGVFDYTFMPSTIMYTYFFIMGLSHSDYLVKVAEVQKTSIYD